MGDETSSRDVWRPGRDRLVGRVLATRFELVELLARGAMGKIYRAHQTDLDRECAIKVLDVRCDPDAEGEFTLRFFREASLAAKLSHPNVVTVFDYGRSDDDVYFIAMELLLGKTLAKVLSQHPSRRLPRERAIDIAGQVCRGLRVAHGEDIVHRDLKPANIFLVDTGSGELAKIVDFGLAKVMHPEAKEEQLTRVGAFMGSARYASPEQILGIDIDGRADIYALGIMLYEMIAGVVPFDGPNEASVLVAHMRGEAKTFREVAPDVDVPEDLERAIRRAFSHRREDRFATAGEFLYALKSASGIGERPSIAGGRYPRTQLIQTVTSSSLTPAPFEATAGPKRARAAHVPKRALWALGAALVLFLPLGALLVEHFVPSKGSTAAEEMDGMPGTVTVTVTGGDCKIAIDGVPKGASPRGPIAVHPGMHTVTCTRPNGRVFATRLRVETQQSASARFSVE
jgi:serine/threonine protein kinase